MDGLDERADRRSWDVDSELPNVWQECKKKLDRVRYSYNRDETRIYLTGMTN